MLLDGWESKRLSGIFECSLASRQGSSRWEHIRVYIRDAIRPAQVEASYGWALAHLAAWAHGAISHHSNEHRLALKG